MSDRSIIVARAKPGSSRVAAGTAVIATGAVLARHNDVTSLERDIFRLVNHLPRAVDITLRGVMQIGALGGVLVTGLAALASLLT